MYVVFFGGSCLRSSLVCREAKKQWISGPSRPTNTIWAKSMGRNQKMHAEANDRNTSGPHDVGRPPPVVVHHVAFESACVSLFCPILYCLLSPHIVLSAFDPYCIFCRVFHQLPCRKFEACRFGASRA